MNVKHTLAAAVAVVALAACGGASASTSTVAAQPTATSAAQSTTSTTGAARPTAAAVATAAAPPPASATTASSAASAQATGKVNANTASIAELQAAFQAAGISNAARWAREVDEYRPYPTDDPSFAKLRRELAKYNPGAETVEKIVATLAL